MTDDKPLPTYRIVRLEAENVKRLKAVSITPKGDVIRITGRNKQGKTSVLDSIWWALTGTENIQKSPIRRGQEKAQIKLDLGTLVILRKFNAKEGGYTTTLTVSSPDGMMAAKPQTFLNDLIGELTMDPLEFAEAKPEDQFDALKSMVTGYDFAEAEAASRRDFATRTDVNRELKSFIAQAEAVYFEADTPDEEIDVTELIAELEDATDFNTALGEERQRRQARAERRERLDKQADDYDRQAVDYRRLADEAEAEAKKLRKESSDIFQELKALPPVNENKDPRDLSAAINSARAINQNVARKLEKARLAKKAAELKAESDQLTQRIDEREQLKRKAIAAAKLPVDDIGFGDGFITLNDLPFDQASDAEQLEASIAVAMAKNPRIRILRIREGSRLDDDAIKLVADLAEKYDCQVWMETVSQTGKPGAILIEDGEVKEDDQ